MTWLEALEQCRSNNMDLASIVDTFQQSVLTVNVSRARTPMWIGLFSEDVSVLINVSFHFRLPMFLVLWCPAPRTGSTTAGRTTATPSSAGGPQMWAAGRVRTWTPMASGKPPSVRNSKEAPSATNHTVSCAWSMCFKNTLKGGGGVWETLNVRVAEEVIATPEDVAVKCPHKINGPNWIPFRNNCYAFQLVSSRWESFDHGRIQETCTNLCRTLFLKLFLFFFLIWAASRKRC